MQELNFTLPQGRSLRTALPPRLPVLVASNPIKHVTYSLKSSYRIAILRWDSIGTGIGKAICEELTELGHEPFYFFAQAALPRDVDVIFLFGPFGKFLNILQAVTQQFGSQRPLIVFWNTEGLPDLRLPWPLMRNISLLRSWLGRMMQQVTEPQDKKSVQTLFASLDARLLRFRYLGDFLYARQQGLIDVFADISDVYTQLFNTQGLPTVYAPFGGAREWYADLNLERDIDVLWMGKRATQRRSLLLDQLRGELRRRGRDIYMADNVERPFIFDEARTHLLNRTKITLNLLRTWYDENSLRICMAAANRSLIVSEPLLPHVPQYQAGVHYATNTIEKLADTILYYLEHDAERQQIANNAHQLLTTQLTLRNSLNTILQAVADSQYQQERVSR